MTGDAGGLIDKHILIILMSGSDKVMEVFFFAGAERAVWILWWRLDTYAFVILSAALR